MSKRHNKDSTPTAPYNKLTPMNERQAEYINAVNTESVILCVGVLGSSKTYIPSVMAAQLLMDKKIDKVVIARPNEGVGKSLGAFKGSKNEKLEGWCTPVTETFKQTMGASTFDYHINKGSIELLALEQVKGRSWDNTFILVDEAEDLDPAQAKSLVTRIGENSTIVITGDIAQQDLKRVSGLQRLLEVSEHAHVPVCIIDFDHWDYCVRSDEARLWGMAFEAWENADG
jgi:phosphate starvation-inducible PhoH-like protein